MQRTVSAARRRTKRRDVGKAVAERDCRGRVQSWALYIRVGRLVAALARCGGGASTDVAVGTAAQASQSPSVRRGQYASGCSDLERSPVASDARASIGMLFGGVCRFRNTRRLLAGTIQRLDQVLLSCAYRGLGFRTRSRPRCVRGEPSFFPGTA